MDCGEQFTAGDSSRFYIKKNTEHRTKKGRICAPNKRAICSFCPGGRISKSYKKINHTTLLCRTDAEISPSPASLMGTSSKSKPSSTTGRKRRRSSKYVSIFTLSPSCPFSCFSSTFSYLCCSTCVFETCAGGGLKEANAASALPKPNLQKNEVFPGRGLRGSHPRTPSI